MLATNSHLLLSEQFLSVLIMCVCQFENHRFQFTFTEIQFYVLSDFHGKILFLNSIHQLKQFHFLHLYIYKLYQGHSPRQIPISWWVFHHRSWIPIILLLFRFFCLIMQMAAYLHYPVFIIKYSVYLKKVYNSQWN